jgi:hypothetical protein
VLDESLWYLDLAFHLPLTPELPLKKKFSALMAHTGWQRQH